MKKNKRETRCFKRMMAMILAVILVICMMPEKVQASDYQADGNLVFNNENPNITIGSEGLVPDTVFSMGTLAYPNDMHSYKYNVEWIVIDDSNTNTIRLYARHILGYSPIWKTENVNHQDYPYYTKECDLQKMCNSLGNYMFTAIEKGAIAYSDVLALPGLASGKEYDGMALLTPIRFNTLLAYNTAREAAGLGTIEDTYAYYDEYDPIMHSYDRAYLLMEHDPTISNGISISKKSNNSNISETNSYGVRPTCLIEKSKVLLVDRSIPVYATGADKFYSAEGTTKSRNAVVTLKDDDNRFSVDTYVFDGNKFKISYSGAKTDDNSYIKALVVDSSENVKYTAYIKSVSSESGEAYIDLSGLIANGNVSSGDKLYVYNTINENNEGEIFYGSGFSELSLTKNIGCFVTNNLSNLTTDNAADTCSLNSDYEENLSAVADYMLPDTITVKCGGTELGAGDYSYNNETGALKVFNYTNGLSGDLEITAAGVEKVYSLTSNKTTLDFDILEYRRYVPEEIAELYTVTNNGNQALELSIYCDEFLNSVISKDLNSGGKLILEPGESIEVTVSPKADISALQYYGHVGFVCNQTNNYIAAQFIIRRPTYDVSFNNAGHGELPELQQVSSFNRVTKPEDPEELGYTFEYWMLDGQEYDFDSEVEGPLTLVAKWTTNVYNISYELNGGECEGNPTEYTVEDSIHLENPSKFGYDFIGWSGSDISGNDNLSVDVNTQACKNLAFKANWLEISHNDDNNNNGSGNGGGTDENQNGATENTTPADKDTQPNPSAPRREVPGMRDAIANIEETSVPATTVEATVEASEPTDANKESTEASVKEDDKKSDEASAEEIITDDEGNGESDDVLIGEEASAKAGLEGTEKTVVFVVIGCLLLVLAALLVFWYYRAKQKENE